MTHSNRHLTRPTLSYKALTLALLPLTPTLAFGVDLVGAYEDALRYDATLAASKAAYQAEQEGIEQARATLLPSITADATANHVNHDADRSGDSSDKSASLTLNLTQPLFRAQNWFSYEASKLTSEKARADFEAAQQALILNTAEAYFNVLRSQENLTTAMATEAAFKRQWEQAKERFDVGLIAITEVHEAKASYDATKTSRIQAEGALNIAFEGLASLTGVVYDDIKVLGQDFPIATPAPADADSWVGTAYNQNWSIKAAEYNLQSLQESLKTSKAGHYPTVDLFASYGYADFNTSGFGDDRMDATIGVNVSVPLYQGGATTSTVRQTQFRVEQARQSLEGTRRNVKLNTRSLLTQVNTDIDTVASQQLNIVSRESALEATRAGYSVGTRNIVEVLDAERNYYVALLDFANARYDYVIDSLSLKQAAGTLSPQDLIDLNRWLQASGK